MPEYFGSVFGAAPFALGGLVEVFEKGGRKVSYNLYKEGVFAVEMVRYLAERNAGVFGYVAHRNLRVPLFAYQLFGGEQYFLSGAGRLFFARFVHWGFSLYVRAKIGCPPPFLCQTNSENFRAKKHYLANRIVASFSGAPEKLRAQKNPLSAQIGKRISAAGSAPFAPFGKS